MSWPNKNWKHCLLVVPSKRRCFVVNSGTRGLLEKMFAMNWPSQASQVNFQLILRLPFRQGINWVYVCISIIFSVQHSMLQICPVQSKKQKAIQMNRPMQGPLLHCPILSVHTTRPILVIHSALFALPQSMHSMMSFLSALLEKSQLKILFWVESLLWLLVVADGPHCSRITFV